MASNLQRPELRVRATTGATPSTTAKGVSDSSVSNQSNSSHTSTTSSNSPNPNSEKSVTNSAKSSNGAVNGTSSSKPIASTSVDAEPSSSIDVTATTKKGLTRSGGGESLPPRPPSSIPYPKHDPTPHKIGTARCKNCGEIISREIEAIEAHMEECLESLKQGLDSDQTTSNPQNNVTKSTMLAKSARSLGGIFRNPAIDDNACTRIVYRIATPNSKLIYPREFCVLQDAFIDTNGTYRCDVILNLFSFTNSNPIPHSIVLDNPSSIIHHVYTHCRSMLYL
jgi:hypothetical protein